MAQEFELARLRRWRFGKKSEALGADQIALWEAELDANIEAIEQRLARHARSPRHRISGAASSRLACARCLIRIRQTSQTGKKVATHAETA